MLVYEARRVHLQEDEIRRRLRFYQIAFPAGHRDRALVFCAP